MRRPHFALFDTELSAAVEMAEQSPAELHFIDERPLDAHQSLTGGVDPNLSREGMEHLGLAGGRIKARIRHEVELCQSVLFARIFVIESFRKHFEHGASTLG